MWGIPIFESGLHRIRNIFVRQDNIQDSNAKEIFLHHQWAKRSHYFPRKRLLQEEKTRGGQVNSLQLQMPREGQISDTLRSKRKSTLNVLFSDRYFSMN